MSDPILVLGATGGQGGAVVRALRGRGATIRALVRDPAAPRARALAENGVELVAGDLSDRASVRAAMDGAVAAFAVTTPFEAGTDAEVAQGRAIVGAALDARLPHMVFSSVAGADAGTGVPHFESKGLIETELRASGLQHTVLAPTYFFDNALGSRHEALAGVLRLPITSDHPLQQLDRADLADLAAIGLTDPGRLAGRRIEVAGDAPTPAEMAEALTRVLGQEVRHDRQDIATIGDPDMHAMWTFLAEEGYQADPVALRAEFPEIAWTRFADWAGNALTPFT
ncbi:NmrA/HSCARG family protein [Pseudonocardia petroleophila]|uniref:NmrA/HSCARG family protein n=1 Tax=Pseudonocardia petroleophila TaxID=37331 RepID=A0A7G7MH13_9PSEU|nr:NmrA/HSCARG family protein [Pseudonocardia petroleophila]QNG52074.1 NmrA/HSCARG family protein [Pseudonocardia petroleophila]